MTRALRIAFSVTDPLGRGANYLRARALATELVRAGHAATLLCGITGMSLRPGVANVDGVRHLTLPNAGLRGLAAKGMNPYEAVWRGRALLQERFDIVHLIGHRPAVLLPSLLTRRRRNTLLVVDWTDLWGRPGIADQRGRVGRLTVGWMDTAFEHGRNTSADAVVAITSYLAGLAVEQGFEPRRVLTLPNGADTRAIRPAPAAEARRNRGLDPNGRFLLHSGLSAFDQEMVLDVFGEALARDPSVRLLLLGGAARGALDSWRYKPLGARVVEIGHVPHADLGPILACCDAALLPLPPLPFNLARFPNRAGDSLAAGRPIVTHAKGDLGALVKDHRLGLAVDGGRRELAEAAVQLLRDPALAQELGRNARRFAETRLDWSLLAPSLLEFYVSLM